MTAIDASKNAMLSLQFRFPLRDIQRVNTSSTPILTLSKLRPPMQIYKDGLGPITSTWLSSVRKVQVVEESLSKTSIQIFGG